MADNSQKKITLELTKEQYSTLMEMVFAGNYVLSCANEKNEEKYNKIESEVFSHAKEIGKSKFAEFVDFYGGWLPTKAFEDAGIMKSLDEYDNISFWQEISRRLAMRDVAENVRTSNTDILYEAIIERTDEYDEFFEKNDLNSLYVKGIKPISKTYNTFRSMDIGEIESYGNKSDHDDDDDCDDCDCEDCNHLH